MKDPITNIEFYKEQYLHEHERSMFYDKVIQYPSTLLVLFIAGAVYSFNNYFEFSIFHYGRVVLESRLDWFVIIVIVLFVLSMLVSAFFLFNVFHGFTRKYNHLPFTGELFNYEMKLYKHYYKYSEERSYEDKREDAKSNTCGEFGKHLKSYYIQTTDVNQRINDRRAIYYAKTRTFLFVDLVLLIVFGIMGFLN